MKLKKVTFAKVQGLPGLRAGDLTTLDCNNPPAPLKDWRILLRGASAYLVSPPGWTSARPTDRKDCGPVTVYEFPRADLILHWETGLVEDVMKGGKYESEPLGWKQAVVDAEKSILSQIPPGQVGDA